MAALREQLDRASFLFLMCSRYTAMSLHTSPASLHTHSSISRPLVLASISCFLRLSPKRWFQVAKREGYFVMCFY